MEYTCYESDCVGLKCFGGIFEVRQVKTELIVIYGRCRIVQFDAWQIKHKYLLLGYYQFDSFHLARTFLRIISFSINAPIREKFLEPVSRANDKNFEQKLRNNFVFTYF